MKECKICKSTGIHVMEAFTSSFDGKHYPRHESQCNACWGEKQFSEPNYKEILDLILSTKGKNKNKLRSTRPADNHNIISDRAYYVWRMARFHGGADVTMPMSASLGVRGDPYRDILDKMADAVAKTSFGTNLAAAHRWGHALGYLDRELPGLPDNAYSGGPVTDNNKPEEEQQELF